MRAGVRLEDFPDRISWNALWDHVTEVLREPSSHLVSAMRGDKYVPHPSERAAWAVFEQWVNTQMKKGSGYRKVKRPWEGTQPAYQIAAPADDQARMKRRERLAALF